MVNNMVFNNEKEISRFRSMLSLCKRAGKLVSGETACESAIKAGKARVVFLSLEASKNTTKKFTNSSEYYKIPAFVLSFPKEELGRMVGEGQRSVIAVTGGDFAEQLTGFASGRTDGRLE